MSDGTASLSIARRKHAPLAHDMRLADVFGERARTHARGERRGRLALEQSDAFARTAARTRHRRYRVLNARAASSVPAERGAPGVGVSTGEEIVTFPLPCNWPDTVS